MKTFVKFLCMLMCLLMVLSAFSACNDKPETPPDENPPSGEDNPDPTPVDPDPQPSGGDMMDDVMQRKYPGKTITGILYPEDLLALVDFINSAGGAAALTENVVYYLAGDIDLNPGWSSAARVKNGEYIGVGTVPPNTFDGFDGFYGIFDGNGHTISGLYIAEDEMEEGDSLGFFKVLGGTVKDLTLENTYVQGSLDDYETADDVNIGALAGKTVGEGVTLENVTVRANVIFRADESATIGGVIGSTESDLTANAVEFYGKAGIVGTDGSYPAPVTDVTLSQFVGDAHDNNLQLTACVAGGKLICAADATGTGDFCAKGTSSLTIAADCRVEKMDDEEIAGDDVIEIYVAEDLIALWDDDTYEGQLVRLMSDINFNPNWNAEVARSQGELTEPKRFWRGIPEFKGTFDGNGHTITGLCRLVDVSRNSTVGGLVDLLGEGAVIKNLSFSNCAIFAYSSAEKLTETVYIGGVAGKAEGTATIESVTGEMDIWTIGDITAKIGGILGDPDPKQYVTQTLSGNFGMIGKLDRTLLEELFSKQLDEFEEEIIKIYTINDLMDLSKRGQDGETFAGKTIRLMNDIEINSASVEASISGTRVEFPETSTLEWTPIPVFAGLFDGNGYSISGLYAWRNALCINSGNYGGLFDVAKNGAIIKNLIIHNSLNVVNNTGDSAWGSANIHVGGLVGCCDRDEDDSHSFGLTVYNVYVDIDVVILCSNHSTVGGILAFAQRHGEAYTASYNLENVVFAGRVINTDYTLKIPFTSPKDQFAMAQIVANTNWGSKHVITNVLAAGEIICGNTTGVHPILGGKSWSESNGNPVYKSVNCSNVLIGRQTELPKTGYNSKNDENDATFNGKDWSYSEDLGFYMPQSVVKMLLTNGQMNEFVYYLGTPFEAIPNGDEYHVFSAAGLIALAQSGDDFQGKTIYIDRDIDLNPGWSAETKFVDGKVVFPEAPAVIWKAFETFKGTIDGQGHTISGLYSYRTVKEKKEGYSSNSGNYGGLVDTFYDGVIKNLAIVNSIHIVNNALTADGQPMKDDWGSENMRVGGIAALIRKTKVDNNSDKYKLGNSENYGFQVSGCYFDMQVWWISVGHAHIGGVIGRVDGCNYRLVDSMFAFKIGNTNSLTDGTAYYASSKGSQLAIGQLVGNHNYKMGCYIHNNLVVGDIYTGTTGEDAKHISTYIGRDWEGKIDDPAETCLDRFTNTLPGYFYPDEWLRTGGGFYVPSPAIVHMNSRNLGLLMDGTTVTGIGILPESKATGVTCKDGAFEVVIPDGVTAIYAGAFSSRPEITGIVIPTTVTSIGESAFVGCDCLTSITYLGTRDEWNAIEMEGAWDLDATFDIICTDGASCVSHSWNEGVVTKEMTCLEHGNRLYTCTICGSHKNVLIISPLDHKMVPDEATATCTEGGLSEGAHCLICGEILVEQTLIPALGHDFGEDGKCKRCGAKKPSEGLEFTSNGDGTCTVTGLGSYTDTNLVIPDQSPDEDTVTAIGDFAFANTAITSVQIPVTVVSIGTGAFANCSALEIKVETVMTGNPVYTSTANGIFKDNGATLVRFTAVKTTTYQLPASVTTIEEYAFSGCSKLINFSVNSGNPNYKAAGNNIYTKDGKTLVRAKNANSVTIAAGTVNIAAGAFSGCDKLTSITLPASLETIGDYGFYGCAKLATVTNNATNLKHVGAEAFTGTLVETPPTGSED